MISEALELHVEGGRVSHNWYIYHGYGGLGGDGDGGGGWYACGTKPGGSIVERCQSTSQVRGDILMTPDHTAIQVRSSGLG